MTQRNLRSWGTLIQDEMSNHGEAWSDVVASTLTEAQKTELFNDGFGGICGIPFTVWTEKRVYFPAQYDGCEWAASVSRHPDGQPTRHVGGG